MLLHRATYLRANWVVVYPASYNVHVCKFLTIIRSSPENRPLRTKRVLFVLPASEDKRMKNKRSIKVKRCQKTWSYQKNQGSQGLII